MKTAMQILIDELKDYKRTTFSDKLVITFWIVKAEKLLEKEKRQIIDAYEWGLIDGEKEAKREQKYDHSGISFYEDFYNKKP